MRYVPAPSPKASPELKKSLRDLGQRIRDRRKALGISATTTAEAAGMSRVTFHRIERGEESVTMGAYLNALSALGLGLDLVDPKKPTKLGVDRKKLPSQIKLADYPQLKRLAWQLKDTKQVTPHEALELYERNWRHVDVQAMGVQEKELLEQLLEMFGRRRLLV